MEAKNQLEPVIVMKKTPGQQPPVMLEIPQELDPIRWTVERLISALTDNHTSLIGIVGAGGVGKTRIAGQIGEEIRRKKLFEAVMTTSVGRFDREPESRIAREIYGNLTGRFNWDNALSLTIELLSKLLTQKRALIILDDVWDAIDLKKAGIPKGPCKILIMSRSEEVCSKMKCELTLKLQINDDTSSSSAGSASMSSESIDPWIQSLYSIIHYSLKELVVGDTSALSKESVNSNFKGRKNPLDLENVQRDTARRPLEMPLAKYQSVDSSKSSFLNVEKKAGDGKRGEIEEVCDEAKSKEYKTYLKDFILFCSVLPVNYEFTKDVLVWQWIAGGLIELGDHKRMEEVCGECFDTLVDMHYFVPSHYDHIFHQMKYKIGDEMAVFLQTQPLKPKFGKYLDCKGSYAAEVVHMSITFKNIVHMKLGVFKEYGRLRTLVSYDGYGLDLLPSYIFLELQKLKILNLSGTNIAVLPSSVENLRELRFFDMSKTPIRWLPETIRYFSHLETLKIDGCLQLIHLPKCMDKLISLQHLILDVRRLESMPIGIGKLSNLRTLNAFLVDEGSVGDLKNLNKLRGSFCLLNLENVGSKEEAIEACLHDKVDLWKIELHWSDIQDEKSSSEEEILGSLRPPTSIRELGILFYSGEMLPSWICSREFSELQSINLYGCRYCSSLPSLGELPSLKSLSIKENNEIMAIDSSFFRKKTNHVAFPKLEKLSICSMSKLEKWTGFENGDFPSLRNLIVEYCPRFVGLTFLSHLNSLSQLEIRYCPDLSFLPEDGLPPSLESLMIKQSPKLKAQCCDEQWKDWSKVARVPSIYIDDQEFSPKFSIIQETGVERDQALGYLS